MKTVIIYDQCAAEAIQFIVFDCDLSHLDGVYINHCRHDSVLQDELTGLLYDQIDGGSIHDDKLVEKFPTELVAQGAIVIVAGFLP